MNPATPQGYIAGDVALDALQAVLRDTTTGFQTLGNVILHQESPGAAYARAMQSAGVLGDYEPSPATKALYGAVGDKLMESDMVAGALEKVAKAAREHPEAALQAVGSLAIADVIPGWDKLSTPAKVAIKRGLKKGQFVDKAVNDALDKVAGVDDVPVLGKALADAKEGELDLAFDVDDIDPDDLIILRSETGEYMDAVQDPGLGIEGNPASAVDAGKAPNVAESMKATVPTTDTDNILAMAKSIDAVRASEMARKSQGYTVPFAHITQNLDEWKDPLHLHGGKRGVIYGYDPSDIDAIGKSVGDPWHGHDLLGTAAVGLDGYLDALRVVKNRDYAKKEIADLTARLKERPKARDRKDIEQMLAGAMARYQNTGLELAYMTPNTVNLPLYAKEGVIGFPQGGMDTINQASMLSDFLDMPGTMDQKTAGGILGQMKAGRPLHEQVSRGHLDRYGVARYADLTDAEKLNVRGKKEISDARVEALARMFNDYLAQNDTATLSQVKDMRMRGQPSATGTKVELGKFEQNPARNLAEAMADRNVWQIDWSNLESGERVYTPSRVGETIGSRAPLAQALFDRGFTGTRVNDEMGGYAMAILDPDYLRHRYFDYSKGAK